MMTETEIARCGSCRAAILWCVTENGRPMPVDAEPVPDGNVLLARDEESGDLVAVVVPKGQMLLGEDRGAHLSHFATCPDSSRWRKR